MPTDVVLAPRLDVLTKGLDRWMEEKVDPRRQAMTGMCPRVGLWNSLPHDVVTSSGLSALKSRFDRSVEKK